MDEPQRKPSYPSWNYSFGEIVADGAVHATGVVLGLVGSVLLVLWAAGSAGTVELAAVFVYVAGLLAMLGFSAAYNMWRVSPTKWLLRRFDHSAIYVMIAGTYTPLLLQIKATVATVALLALGGLLYSGGVIFHVWSRLRFQNAIWHAFVLTAAACHWGAIVDCIVLARA